MSDAADAILGAPAADPAAAADPAGGDPAAAAAGAGGDPAGGAAGGDENPFAWAGELSDEALAGGKPSDKAWLANKGYKSAADMISAMRGLEANVGGRLAMPKDENDKEGWAAFYKAGGRPETPEGYELKTADGQDDPTLTRFAAKAHELGLSKAQLDGLVSDMDAFFAESGSARDARVAADVETARRELRQAWGGEYDKTIELSRRAAEKFGFDRDLLTALSAEVGVKKMMERMAAIGKAIGEDSFVGDPSKALGGMDVKTAQAELDAMNKDPVKAKALIDGTDAQLVARRKQLIDIVAAEQDRQIAA